MAVVFEATHRNQKRFAVKMLHPELSVHEDLRTRFLREGYAANSLHHPGAVAVLDDDVDEDGSAFLVLELLEGADLEKIADEKGGRLPARTVMALGHQLLDVLAAAHRKGVIHRDIKPPNLFLTEEGTLKVLDFGIARVRDAFASAAHKPGFGAILGTPGFMAPEQARARSNEIDGQTDVWAAGATLFNLLTGELVHSGETASELLVEGAMTPARSVSSVLPDTPSAIGDVIDRALAFEKGARWPTAAAMRDAIRDAYLATYDEPISRADLEGLAVARERDPFPVSSGEGSDLEAVEVPSPAPIARPARAALMDTAPMPREAQASQTADARAAQTIIVSASRGPGEASPSSWPRRRMDRLMMAVAAIVTLGAATFALRGGQSAPVAPTAAGSSIPTPVATPLQTSIPAPPPSTPWVAAPSGEPTVSPTPAVAAPSAAVASARVTPRRPAPTPVASGAVPSVTPAGPTVPCTLVETLDKSGESHFSCPCARCR